MTNKGIAKPVLLSSLTILLCLLFSQKVLASSEMVDSYQQNDMDTTVTDITWKGQSWTATSTYTVTSVKIKARRESTPGTTFMSIRNANDKATDVCTSTVNGNDFSDSTYALAEFTFSNCPEFQASSTYFLISIVLLIIFIWEFSKQELMAPVQDMKHMTTVELLGRRKTGTRILRFMPKLEKKKVHQQQRQQKRIYQQQTQ